MNSTFSPAVLLDKLKTKNGKVVVVRDDVLKAGTKQRAAIPYLQNLKNKGAEEFVYASPFSGYAQIALAYSANQVGAKSLIFAQYDPTTKSESKFTKIAAEYLNFSDIFLCKSFEDAEYLANLYCNKFGNSIRIPLGFADPYFMFCLEEELKDQWIYICDNLGYIPEKIWLPVGSGTFAKCFRNVVPKTTKIICVDVKILKHNDSRICDVRGLSNIEYKTAIEDFLDPCCYLPPIPSNIYYDSKLWRFVYSFAGEKDIWWNVAA